MQDLRRIIWLASYPKSGNTWVRMLLAHYFMPKGKAPDINNIRQFTTGDARQDIFDAAVGGTYHADSPDEWIHVRQKVVAMIAASKPNHHFVKTHCQASKYLGIDLIPPQCTAGAIYVMRNPFDLAPSFARHLNTDIDTAIEIMLNTEAINGTESGIYDAIGRWDKHVSSWADAPGLSIHVLRYEDMIDHTARAMRDLILKFLKAPLDAGKLAYAVKATSFETLKKQEAELGFVERPAGMDQFFARGQSGVWRTDLTPEQVARLRDGFGDTLTKWYPELMTETAEFAASG
ncbi:MAG: sulfotransferase domain-containing protein [Pseudomonadota bacterium]